MILNNSQKEYRGNTPAGDPGGLVDNRPINVGAFLNDEGKGEMLYGVGVVIGERPGWTVALPTSESTAAEFEGITINSRLLEHNLVGKVEIRHDTVLGVMQQGRIYARVSEDAVPAYKDKLYMILLGDEAGYFTNESGDNTIQIHGRFIGSVVPGTGVAPVELFSMKKGKKTSTTSSSTDSGTTGSGTTDSDDSGTTDSETTASMLGTFVLDQSTLGSS